MLNIKTTGLRRAELAHLQSSVGNVSHGVLERPDDGVKHELELRWGDVEERRKTVVVHRLKHRRQ